MMDLPVAIVEELPAAGESGAAYPAEAEAYALPAGFAYLDERVSGILWDAKYASEDNFTGGVVDGYEANRVAVAEKMLPQIETARDLARKKGYLLLVWDAARPQMAVDRFVRWAAEPEDGKTKEAHYPRIKKSSLFKNGYVAKRSGHTRGCAIDLTLTDLNGEPLDMGGDFDLMDEISHPDYDGLNKAQRANRKLLAAIMKKAGFKPISTEWWHYVMINEPFPGEYFDFVIGGRAQAEPFSAAIVPAPPEPGVD